MNQLAEAAIGYAENGIPVFPIFPGQKSPPLTKNGVKDATTNLEQVKYWWEKWPTANIAIAVGHEVFGLDIDYKDGADPKFLERLPPTVIAKSPNGGHHAYFKVPNGGIKNGLKIEKGVTVRSLGYYFIVPPSIYGSGSSYAWNNRGLSDGEISECPEWILEKNKEEKKPFVLPDLIQKGEQHTNLFLLGSSLRGKGASQAEILASFTALNGRLEEPAPVKNLENLANDICRRYEQGNKEKSIDGPVLPDKGGKGRIKGTIENVKALLNYLGIVVRYNVISKEQEILIPENKFTIDNKMEASFARIISECNRYGIPIGNLRDHLTWIADHNLYNPVATWIESREWDGASRLAEMFNTIKSSTELKEILMYRWFLSCVAAVYEPSGVSAHGVLVFRGNQYIGKTKWFKNLVPASIGIDVLKDGAILHPDNKDSVFQVVSKWLVELGELDATFRKSDIAQLKAFLTKDQDVIRRAYAAKESHYARRTVFFASVNEKYFLNDPTGNRRFWTIECEGIDYDHNIDMQQFWAEVRECYLRGEKWYLTQQEHEALNKSNEEFHQADPIEELIRHNFKWDSEYRNEWSATQICEAIGIKSPSQQQTRRAASVMRKMNQKQRLLDGIVRYEVPPAKMTPEM